MFWFLKYTIGNHIFNISTKICEIQNKRWNAKSLAQFKSTIVFPSRDILKKINYFHDVNYYKIIEKYTENRARSVSIMMRMCSSRPIEP